MMKWTPASPGVMVGTMAMTAAAATVAAPPNRADGGGDVARNAQRMLDEGRRTFRHEAFGDEAFWSDALLLNKAIAGAANGGVGGGVSPKTALSVGLKVDAHALPKDLVSKIKAGKVNLDDPATTLALLKLDAVVGLKGTFDKDGHLRLGITCALCHSTVDDSFSAGIGQRLDGWPNRDLNVGAIVSLAPDLSSGTKLLGVDLPTLKKVLGAWGPGKFDAVVFMDGKAMRPDGKTGAVLLPAAYGLAGVNMHTYTGWGSVTYWDAFVANLEMHGKGTRDRERERRRSRRETTSARSLARDPPTSLEAAVPRPRWPTALRRAAHGDAGRQRAVTAPLRLVPHALTLLVRVVRLSA